MVDMTYTLDEMETETGYSKRTIRNYIQNIIGTGQAIGRQNARYPQTVLDKLLFIRKVQELAPSLMLSEIREILAATTDADVVRVVSGEEPLEIADVRTAEGTRDFEIRAKTGNKHQKVVAVTLDGSKAEDSGRPRTMYSRRRQVPVERPDDWKVIKLDKDVELRVRGEQSSSKLKQLKLLGQLVKSILGSN